MFTGEELLDIGREAFWVTLQVAGPAMLAGLLVGFTIALFQALTQVQELTLVFVPVSYTHLTLPTTPYV